MATHQEFLAAADTPSRRGRFRRHEPATSPARCIAATILRNPTTTLHDYQQTSHQTARAKERPEQLREFKLVRAWPLDWSQLPFKTPYHTRISDIWTRTKITRQISLLMLVFP
jgi:hypothetical protein